ncbi:MAG: nitroreductase [Janthinobacterium lividum]
MIDETAVDVAITTRHSIRAFQRTPVPLPMVEHLLRVAARAPSGSNIQPWRVHVLLGDALARFTGAMTSAFEAGEPEAPEYDYYPQHWRSPYIERRRETGLGLYALAGVEKGDRAGAARQRGRNYTFFGAPVGLIFTIDKDMGRGSWLDFGMLLQSIMVAARGHGLDTCPQAAMMNYPAVVRSHLAIGDDVTIVCGMALGHADLSDPTCLFQTRREALSVFVTVHGAA